jgi:hypothetical protein
VHAEHCPSRAIAAAMDRYDPDDTWKRTDDAA